MITPIANYQPLPRGNIVDPVDACHPRQVGVTFNRYIPIKIPTSMVNVQIALNHTLILGPRSYPSSYPRLILDPQTCQDLLSLSFPHYA